MNLGRTSKSMVVRVKTTSERLIKVGSEQVSRAMSNAFPSNFKELHEMEEYKSADWWVKRNLDNQLTDELMKQEGAKEKVFAQLSSNGYIDIDRSIIQEETSIVELVE